MLKREMVQKQIDDLNWQLNCLWIFSERLFVAFIEAKMKADTSATYKIRKAEHCNFNVIRIEEENKEVQVALFEYTIDPIGIRITTSTETKTFVFGGRENQKEIFPFIDSLFQ
jgi:hypothetical protein